MLHQNPGQVPETSTLMHHSSNKIKALQAPLQNPPNRNHAIYNDEMASINGVLSQQKMPVIELAEVESRKHLSTMMVSRQNMSRQNIGDAESRKSPLELQQP